MGYIYRSSFFFVFLAILFNALSCSEKEPAVTPVNPLTIDVGALDTSVSPCDDFYTYACGTWIKNTEIPAGYSRWTKSFNVLADDSLSTLKTTLEKFAAKESELKVGSSEKLGDFYGACLDSSTAEASGQELLPGFLAEIDSIASKEALVKSLGAWHLRGVNAFFGYFAAQDAKDARRAIGHIDRGGMGLPDRDYYFEETPSKVKLRVQYQEHIARVLILSGVDANVARENAVSIVALETQLAKNALKKEDRRDPNKIYHLIGLDGLKGLAADIAWDPYFEAVGKPGLKELNVVEPEFFKGMGQVLAAVDLGTLKAYLRWQFLHAVAPQLGKKFEEENFEFYGKALSGKKEPLPRWKTCINATSGAMGEALGEAFVLLKFGESGKTEAKKLIENLTQSVRANFGEVGWMDQETRTRAIEKLERIVSKMGYPDKYRDYSALNVDRKSYLKNELSAREFEAKRNWAKVGQPVDRSEWEMVPHEVNAYYNPSMNEIVFPAGILQSPFFHANAPLANNYGGIGMVIGHEITHAFDDEGRQFDGDGNLKEWWTANSAKAFDERAACLVKQYDEYTVAGGVHLNGKLTLGENIADLGGLKLSHAAFQEAKKGRAAGTEVAGLNDEQQFFVAFAQGWCSKMTPEEEKLRAATDPHANPRYRVNGVVVNLPQFEKTFGCAAGKAMAPANRCAIW